MTRVGVVVGTYGDSEFWEPLATRAHASVKAQTRRADEFCWCHHATLQRARNEGAASVKDCDYLIFLDADDELDPLYIESMLITQQMVGSGKFIFRPNTQGIHESGHVEEPRMIPRTDLKRQNCAVIGTMCPTDLFFEVGGFGNYEALEDWALWRSMVRAGAQLVDVGDAIYRIHIRENSRNAPTGDHGAAYQRIIKEIPL